MWEHVFETRSNVSADRLCSILADLAGWPDWHPDVEAVRFEHGLVLIREQGKWARMSVEESIAPFRFVVSRQRLFSRLRTAFEFKPRWGATGVRVTVQLLGPGTFLSRDRLEERWTDSVSELFQCLIERARVFSEPELIGVWLLNFTGDMRGMHRFNIAQRGRCFMARIGMFGISSQSGAAYLADIVAEGVTTYGYARPSEHGRSVVDAIERQGGVQVDRPENELGERATSCR